MTVSPPDPTLPGSGDLGASLPAPVSPAPMGGPNDGATDAATGIAVGEVPPGTDPRLGLVVTHRRYVPYSDAHYAGHLVDGAYALGLFGDVATELCIRTDGDEGLFACYDEVQFRAPMRGGDVLEITGTLTRIGTRSRDVSFAAHVTCRGRPDQGASAAEVLDPPLIAVTARGTVVVPPTA
jgi:3-aminobutyryl-CoA ammonia-lyase